MARRKASHPAQAGVVIDIDGVGPATRLADLTVTQFVQLLSQTISQPQPRVADAQTVAEIVRSLQKSFGDQPGNARVKALQLDIIDRLAEAIGRVRGRGGVGR